MPSSGLHSLLQLELIFVSSCHPKYPERVVEGVGVGVGRYKGTKYASCSGLQLLLQRLAAASAA